MNITNNWKWYESYAAEYSREPPKNISTLPNGHGTTVFFIHTLRAVERLNLETSIFRKQKFSQPAIGKHFTVLMFQRSHVPQRNLETVTHLCSNKHSDYVIGINIGNPQIPLHKCMHNAALSDADNSLNRFVKDSQFVLRKTTRNVTYDMVKYCGTTW